jgi:DNA-directed RNA polymerase subunit K/omega
MSGRHSTTNAFELVVVAALRAKQLMRGCTPRVPRGLKITTTARMEVAAGKVDVIITPAPPVLPFQLLVAK